MCTVISAVVLVDEKRKKFNIFKRSHMRFSFIIFILTNSAILNCLLRCISDLVWNFLNLYSIGTNYYIAILEIYRLLYHVGIICMKMIIKIRWNLIYKSHPKFKRLAENLQLIFTQLLHAGFFYLKGCSDLTMLTPAGCRYYFLFNYSFIFRSLQNLLALSQILVRIHA